jgi:hypothetical protein
MLSLLGRLIEGGDLERRASGQVAGSPSGDGLQSSDRMSAAHPTAASGRIGVVHAHSPCGWDDAT